MNRLPVVFIFIFTIIGIAEAAVLLYNTENSGRGEEVNCIYYSQISTVKYCIRWGTNFSTSTNINTCLNGKRWHFSELLSNGISPWDVLSWSSSVEKADDYARVFYNRSKDLEEEPFLCNCSEGVFGKNCEYQLLFDPFSFEKALHTLLHAHQDPMAHQEYGSILCYETLECDYGMLCLDWRNICDGEQNCMDGIDEENCDLLEFNECENDEYRCEDGMCIAEEYWLDGSLDCMDWTDETPGIEEHYCATEPLPILCDDRKCPIRRWSCGDGECMVYLKRYIYLTVQPRPMKCFSMREFNYMCELASDMSLWTKPNGRCAEKGYNDTSLILSSNVTKCMYHIRCALSEGAEAGCPCNGTNCNPLMQGICEHRRAYSHPDGGLIRPWLLQSYTWEQNWYDKVPTIFRLYGSLRCRGFHVTIPIRLNLQFGSWPLEMYVCSTMSLKYNQNTTSPYKYSATCWNDSITFNGRPYAFHDVCPDLNLCFSEYRITDGIRDCFRGEDENYPIVTKTSHCRNIQKHRFQCSSEQITCLPVKFVTSPRIRSGVCANRYDRTMKGNGRYLDITYCGSSVEENECDLLRYYIGNSSIPNSTFTDIREQTNNMQETSIVIPFRYYCDTFWDKQPLPIDENVDDCSSWVCLENFFQCRNGQCILIDWVCDGEWDCSDASDEFGLPDEWIGHNQHISAELNERKNLCREKLMLLPFSDLCNFSYEYPCYRSSTTNPLNISTHRPCINQTQIGDRIEDCYGGIDEKNTFEDCKGSMMGYTFRCGDKCVRWDMTCYKDQACSTSVLCSHKSQNSSWCAGSNDVVCLNRTCAENARCDRIYQCQHGEDEYWCPLSEKSDPLATYRYGKWQYRLHTNIEADIRLFPELTVSQNRKEKIISVLDESLSQSPPVKYSTKQENSADNFFSKSMDPQIKKQLTYICNQGFPLWPADQNNVHPCLCPPTFYGPACQFFSDRISILTHLDLTTLPASVSASLFTVVVRLNFANITVDHHLFRVNSALETQKPIQHQFFLLYSRSNDFLNHKKSRYFNRTDILRHHPYSVHFDIFTLTQNETNELGSFHYPIYFDFLPAFRLAIVLKFPPWIKNSILNPCIPNPCNSNSSCKPILNKNQSFYCSCKSGHSGLNCEEYHVKCSAYCNSDSICRPNHRSLISNPDRPLCICPLDHFGPRCYLRNEACKLNPCGLNAICHPTHDPSGEYSAFCQCAEGFYGDRCQNQKSIIQVQINMTASVIVSVVQFYGIFFPSYRLYLYHQQVTHGLPQIIRYKYDQHKFPILAVFKTYHGFSSAKYFTLYIQERTKFLNITSTPEECPHILDIIPIDRNITSPSIFKYHQICQNDSNRLCFYDSNYFCVCGRKRKMTECFGHDPMIDHCENCLSGGRCIRGDLKKANDFLCICRPCTQGTRCEFSLQAFGFTLDSLMASETIIFHIIYISVVALLFSIGLFNNYCSFMTFKRTQPRKYGVGNYFIFVTILSQCSLFLFLLKFISILLGAMGLTNNLSCKIISYLLSVFTRSTYWLTSWITINRLLTILFPTSTRIKNPRFAIYSSLGTLVILLAMHIHEPIYYQTLLDSDSSTILCVTNFNRNLVEIYNRVNTLIHYLLPFCIQIISITLLIILAARSRARTASNQNAFRQVLKKQISTQKELYITPVTIILSALPQAILSFSLACTQLNGWKQHTLLVGLLLSYVPQILGFILYVLPSSAYKKEFGETAIAKKIFKWIFKTNAKKT